MSTTVAVFITDLDSKFTNGYSSADKLSWVNKVEENIYADVVKLFAVQYYRRQKNVYQYSLPSGVNFEDVYKVFVDGKKYKRADLRTHEENKSFYYENTKLNIYPIPTDTDAQYVSGASEIAFLATSYTSGASEITFAHNTITTTGDDFTGFGVGCKVTISGCLSTDNNIEAVITEVADKVLTFADNTFDADTTADTGTVNIATNGIYTSGAEFDGFKTGDVILVSGCEDETDNNKYAVCTDVQDSVLTFASGTFTAQEESAAVTIQAPKIKMIYQVKPTTKLIANIAVDTLLIPDRFNDIYLWFCIAQMELLDRQFKEYKNYQDQYNARLADYMTWYENTRPAEPAEDIQAIDDWDSEEDTDFDNC